MLKEISSHERVDFFRSVSYHKLVFKIQIKVIRIMSQAITKNKIINETRIREQVLAFMEHLGIEPVEHNLIIDGTIHRFRTQEDRASETSGAYCIYPDGLPAGFVQDWRKNIKSDWVFDTSELPDDQREFLNSKEVKLEAERLRKQREKEREEIAARASETARVIFEHLPPARREHPYLKRKHVKGYNLRLNDQNALCVPLRDVYGNFKSIQWIPAEKDALKNFFPNAPLTGAFWSVGFGDMIQLILLGEGFATMAKVHELTGFPCVAAMTCYGLKPVAEALKKAYKDAKIIIIADDDAKTANNPGITHAQKVCKELKLQGFISPPFRSPDDGTDWDDFALKYGDDNAKGLLQEKISWLCLSEKERQEIIKREDLMALTKKLDPTVRVSPLELIGGIYPRKFVSAIVAPPGTGKTIFMQKNVSDLSVGGSIFDGFSVEDVPRKSLIFAGEAGYELLVRRGALTRWAINPDNVIVVDQYNYEMTNHTVSLDTAEGCKNIERIIDSTKPDIVFFDTFSSFHDKDENKATEVKPIIKRLADMARSFNIAIVIVHHSRKRTARERSLALNQDDVIGSSVFNRLVSLIIGIEPLQPNEKTLFVRPLKTWFSSFPPFTFTISEDTNGHPVISTDLAPAGTVGNSIKDKTWSYIQKKFTPNDWFRISQIDCLEISKKDMNIYKLRRFMSDFVQEGKLIQEGEKKATQYRIRGVYDDILQK